MFELSARAPRQSRATTTMGGDKEGQELAQTSRTRGRRHTHRHTQTQAHSQHTDTATLTLTLH